MRIAAHWSFLGLSALDAAATIRLGAALLLAASAHGVAGCGAPITARQARNVHPTTPAPAAAASAPGTPSLAGLARTAQQLVEPRRSIVETVLAMVGANAGELDCSRFVQHAYAMHGADLPRTVRGQWSAGQEVQERDLAPGDLVFFAFSRGLADHVGIYTGEGSFAHVSSAAKRVRLESLSDPSFARSHIGARRFLP